MDEPVRVLGLNVGRALSSRMSEDGAFERAADRGWNRHEAESIDPEDPLIVELRAELAPSCSTDARAPETILPGGEKAPSLVMPLVMRGAVFGFVLLRRAQRTACR